MTARWGAICQQAPYARRSAFRTALLAYAGVCALWIPLLAWAMPNDSFKVGNVYLLRPDWRFETRQLAGRAVVGGHAGCADKL